MVFPITDNLIFDLNILCVGSNTAVINHMSTTYDVTETLDVKGESCPMPVVKTKQAIDGLDAEQVLEVLATDSGSMSDIAGWAETTSGVTLLDQSEADEGGEQVYKHYVQKTD